LDCNVAALNYHLRYQLLQIFTDIIIDEPLLINASSTGTVLLINSEYVVESDQCLIQKYKPMELILDFTTGSFIQIGTGNNYNPTSSYPTGYGNYRVGAKTAVFNKSKEIMNAGGLLEQIHSLGFIVAIINSGHCFARL
jgi:hypothetical protein